MQLNLFKMATLKKIKNWFSKAIIASCRSKVMQNGEHIKLLFVIKIFVLSISVAVLL